MARLTRRELEQIIARDLPGHELISDDVEVPGRTPAAEPDEPGRDIAALRETYLGAADGVRDPINEHDQIVAVRAKGADDPYDHRSRPKTVVVSAREKRVIGRQG
jgi:hypothetical protein